MSYLVIANAAAGSAEDHPVETAVGVLRAHGPTEVARTADSDELDVVLDTAGDRTVVVIGGDGSIHAVVAALRERGELGAARLALVPLGTGNDLARSLGLPLEADEAAAVATRGRPRRLDLIVDDAGGVVLNVAHAGLGAEAAARADSMKDRLGSLAYPIGALVAGVRERGWALTVSVDDQPVDLDGDVDGERGERGERDDGRRVLLVAIANGTSIGGGTPIAPTAVPDDGLVDVIVTTAIGPLARVGFAAALRRGEHIGRADVVHRRGKVVRVAGEAVRHNADGELTGELTERTYRVEPAAWSLIVP